MKKLSLLFFLAFLANLIPLEAYKFQVTGEIKTPGESPQGVHLSCHKSCKAVYSVLIGGKVRPLHLHVTVQKKRAPHDMKGSKFLPGIDDHPSMNRWLITVNADTGNDETYLNEAHFADKGIVGTGHQKIFSGDLTYWSRTKGGREVPSDKGDISLTILHQGE